MKRKVYLSILLVIICGFLNGCFYKTDTVNVINKSDTKKVSDSDNLINNHEKKENDNKEIIVDIRNWNHPTKEVFKYWGFKVTKIELLKDKTYPIFYVEHDKVHDIYFTELIKEIAEKNSYWDYKIIDDKGFIEVYCNKNERKILKIITDKGVTDYTTYNFSRYEGNWFDTSFINVNKEYNKIELHFDKDGKSANVVLTSETKETGHAEIKTTVKFDFEGQAKFTFDNDLWGNKGKGKIDISDDSIDVEIQYINRVNKTKGICLESSDYVCEKDYSGIKKAMKILKEEYGLEDMHAGSYIPKTDDDSVYFCYEGKDEKNGYIIAVRRCRDTVIVNWYHFDPNTFQVEIEE